MHTYFYFKMRKSKYVKCIYIFNIFLIVYIVNSALVSCPQFKDLKKNVFTVFSKKAMLNQGNNTINIFFILAESVTGSRIEKMYSV